jgi:multiple sugar transport system substrate-binding protein
MSFQTSRRAFLAGTATTIGGVVLAACGQVATSTETMEEKPAEPKEEAKAVEEPVAEQVTIQFLWPPYSPAKERWHDRLVDAYHEKNPHITISTILDTKLNDRIGTNAAAGGGLLDVAWHGYGWARWGDEGVFLPLEPYVKASGIDLNDYYKSAIDGVSWNGTLHALPLGILTPVMALNLDQFAAAGVEVPSDDWTFDDLVDIGNKLTASSDGRWGVDTRYWYWSTWYVSYGRDRGSVNDEWQQMNYDTPLRAHLVDTRADLWHKHQVEPYGDDQKEETIFANFHNQKTAIFAGYNWLVPSFRTDAQFNWTLHPIPFIDFEGEPTRNGALYTEEIALVEGSKVLDDGWDFTSWICGPEQLDTAARNGDTTPTIKSIAESEAFINLDLPPGERIVEYLRAMETAIPFLLHPIGRDLATPLWKNAQQATQANPTLTPEEATRTAQGEAQAILDEYNASRS